MKTAISVLVFCAFSTALASAATTIANTIPGRYGWAANVGWLDFAAAEEAPSTATHGVVIAEDYLAGHIWSGNCGWIRVGRVAGPNNGHTYSQADLGAGDIDFGVNMDQYGNLTGYAYGANIGWINFGWAGPTDANRPRVNFSDGKLYGYAWGANVGWITLQNHDTSVSTVTTTTIFCPDADPVPDGIADSWERRHFGSLLTASGSSNFDGDLMTDKEEYLAGTDPKNGAKWLDLHVLSLNASVDPGVASLQFTSTAARRYTFEYAPTLASPTVWTPLAGHISFAPNLTIGAEQTTVPTVNFPNPGASPTKRYFWRVIALKPLQP